MTTDDASMPYFVVQIIGLPAGIPTSLDGRWLVEYDPTRSGRAPGGAPTSVHIVATDDRASARRFPDAATLCTYLLRTTARRVREDGQPDRPITAFTIAMEVVDDSR